MKNKIYFNDMWKQWNEVEKYSKSFMNRYKKQKKIMLTKDFYLV